MYQIPVKSVIQTGSLVNRNDIFVVAGIARSERFLQELKLDGIEPAKKLFLPDHHSISAKNLSETVGASSAVTTTAKDYWDYFVLSTYDYLANETLMA